MKAQIENRIENVTLEGMEALVSLLNDIQDCRDKKELIKKFSSENEDATWYAGFFRIGFGSNHMWVKKIVNGEISDKRLILVEF